MTALVLRVIERLFGTTIRSEERRLVVLLTLDLFVLLTVYYVLKIVREPLILLEGGVVSRNAARGAQALILLVLVPAYSFVVNRSRPRRLVTGVLAFFFVSLLAFPALSALGLPTGFAFFVWLGIFSITAVAQFWSLATDVYAEEAGKRLFPVIAAGATVGAVAGSQLVVLASRWLGPMGLVLVAAALLAGSVALTHQARRIAEAHPSTPACVPTPDPRGGFRLILGDRYLLLIGLSILVLNLVNTTGDQVMAILVQERVARLPSQVDRARFIMEFYGSFQTWVSVLTAVLQIFVVGRLLRVAGVRGAILVLPLVALAGYGLLAAAPALLLTRGLKIFENSTDYSLQSTAQQILFLPTSRDVKYKGKVATDTFFVRFGDLGSWAVVSVALQAGWGSTALSLINVAACGVWVALALLLADRYRKLTTVEDAALARVLAPVAIAAPALRPARAPLGLSSPE